MREFFLLTYDGSRNDLQVVSEYSMGPFARYPRKPGSSHGAVPPGTKLWEIEFSSSRLNSGVVFEGAVPKNVELWVSEGDRADLLPNPLSWLILSDHLFGVFCRYGKDDLQIVGVPILQKDSDEPVHGYNVVNLLRVVSAVNMERSVVTRAWQPSGPVHVSQFAFDEARVPSDIHIFRPAEALSDVAISGTVANEIRGLKGVSLIETKTV